ncbi:MAG TPA: anthranilate/aminodeoxychorismate synthase component II [Spirochaetia bacterium]|nr:MAG: anthranilate/aminodeoxychorismate synthase component II [Spirochaetes bacterium GWB1_36_13]HCL56168.1 anthranilate/aminodeoxychorismate synthase component II [Spirochaetia bacterium]
MLLMIDNYDSFTYNLVQYFGELGEEVEVKRNDEITIDEIRKISPAKLVISPGPCSPKDAGISVETIKNFAGKIPILGVCLGHQSIGYAYGANIIKAKALMHGKTSFIFHSNEGVFKNIENPFEATRYHSLAIEKATLHPDFKITAWTQDGEIMGIKHKTILLEGVQFHPESILTQEGKKLLKNFLTSADEFWGKQND